MERNYDNKNISDKIRLISELEHIRSHACRSMVSPNIKDEDRIFYAVIANKARNLRREYMAKEFKDCPDELWCLGKASASLRQVSYETFDGDDLMVKQIDELVDTIWEKITGEDLSGCIACVSDKEIVEDEEIVEDK